MEKVLKKYYGFTRKEAKEFAKLKNKYFDKSGNWKKEGK
tara:strand:+ start:1444 stop:1560 length:117 start_codon:yes stop_codon:yes gene_type:complete